MDTNIFITGAIAGLISDIITHPHHTLKARIMSQGAFTSTSEKGGINVKPLPNGIRGLQVMVKQESFRSLYKGFGIVSVGGPIAGGLFSGGLTLADQNFGNTPMGRFMGGLIAQLFGSVVWVPMEVVKEKLQIQGHIPTKENYTSSMGLISKVVKQEGISGLYRAYWIQNVSFLPFNAISNSLLGEFQNVMIPVKDRYNIPQTVSTFICAFFAAALGAGVTTPLDVVKTRLQVQTSNPNAFDYTGIFDCAQKIYVKEGSQGLWMGMSSRMVALGGRWAIFMTVINELRKKEKR